ncbi:MAG: DUF481 domain-containing protein [Luteimonas sp.]
MSAVWWLAIAGLPVFQQPLAEAPGEPAALAIAAGHVSLRMPCYALACADAEWMAPTRDTTLRQPRVPGTLSRLRPIVPSPLATRRYASLSAPASRRDWVSAQADSSKVQSTYGIEAIRTPDTDIRLQIGTGYRLEPGADDGTATPGPIARGGVALSQRIGPKAQLQQQVTVETGRRNTVVRQTLGVDLLVAPQWTLRSDVDIRHDTAADGGKGATDAESSVKLKYDF